MRHGRRLLATMISAGIVASSLSAAKAETIGHEDTYTITVLPRLEDGGAASAVALTGQGLVAGEATKDGEVHATVWRDGEPDDLGTLGGKETSSSVLWPQKNGRGVVVGVSQTDLPDPNSSPWSCSAFLPRRLGYACRGFVWHDGEMRALPTLGGHHSFATGVNNHSQVVGWAETAWQDPSCSADSGQVQGFLAVRWDRLGQQTVPLAPLPGDSASAATAINDRGRVVGISGACDQAVGRLTAKHPVVWDRGQPRLLPDLGGIAWDTPMAVNQRGDIVGFLNRDAAAGTRADIVPAWWTADLQLRPLPLPAGHVRGQALSINESRQIVGLAVTADGACSAVLWQDEVPVLVQDRLDTDVALCSAGDINDQGVIAGQTVDGAAYLATPNR